MAVRHLASEVFEVSEVPTPTTSSDSESCGSSDEVLLTQPEVKAPPSKRKRRTLRVLVENSSKLKKPRVRTYFRRRVSTAVLVAKSLSFGRVLSVIAVFLLRQTEIKELTDEMARLKKQMEYYENKNEVLMHRKLLVERDMANKAIREALHTQRLSLASAASMLNQFYRDNVTEPFDLPTRLCRDPIKRQAALLRMKNERVQVAHTFMQQRYHYQTTSEFCDRKKFEATNGDLVSLRFEILPMPGARSVKAIIDALQEFVYNIEISVSEVVGDITVRENDDAQPGSPVAQHRLVGTIANVVQTDINNVTFAEYRPAGPPGSDERELGMMVCDAVDEDELFPYQPLMRVRQDMTVITCLAWHQSEHGDPVIVMTRWWCVRIRKSDIYMPPFVVERIRKGAEKVGDAMFLAARRASGLMG